LLRDRVSIIVPLVSKTSKNLAKPSHRKKTQEKENMLKIMKNLVNLFNRKTQENVPPI